MLSPEHISIPEEDTPSAGNGQLSRPARRATIAILGGEPVVARALELLLTGAGYDARLIQDIDDQPPDPSLERMSLLLLAPTLDAASLTTKKDRIKALATLATLPALALVTDISGAPRKEDGTYYVPWPCRTADLAREIESALLRHGPA